MAYCRRLVKVCSQHELNEFRAVTNCRGGRVWLIAPVLRTLSPLEDGGIRRAQLFDTHLSHRKECSNSFRMKAVQVNR